MYDLVEEKFYSNAINGTFGSGEEVENVPEKVYNNFIPTVNSNTRLLSNNNHTLYAVWKANPIITFNANGGNVNPTTKMYLLNSNYTDLPVPTRD